MKKNAKVFAQACVSAGIKSGSIMLALLVLLLSTTRVFAADFPAARFYAAPPSTVTGRVTDSKNAPMELSILL